jgi:hypothetical protein
MANLDMQSPFTADFETFTSTNATMLSSMADGPANPTFWQLVYFVLKAVLEVVAMSLPGYIITKMGLFTPEVQKQVAGANVMFFTPCLSKS